ncbi:MAG: hypothetical protein CMN72_06680 [Sphingomonas sp.]|nr:hypothetical protein [Sphingomonas sp.]
MEDSPTVQAVKWAATATGVLAAFMVSLDLGRRTVGAGFVIFTVSSVAWITAAALSTDWALGTQNAVLFAINIFGIYRYLIRATPGHG